MLEFISWFVLLGLFAVFQRRLCRRHPGIRTACRSLFACTLAVVVVPGVWAIFRTPHDPLGILRQVSHYFGLGVYAQTSLRAMIELKWLTLAPIGVGLTATNSAVLASKERQLVDWMSALPGLLGGEKARGDRSPK
jgi:hypothetical protein